ncbi:MAG: endonuclease, partial [Ignavibacteria bacterium]|nr:endonuclease [Ignavibacteria bacterium]
FYSINMLAQISVSADSIAFPQTFTGSADSFSVYVKNLSAQTSDINFYNLKNVYSLSDTVLTIQSNDSNLVWIKYRPDQNVIDKDLLIITGDDSTVGNVISLNGSGKYGDSYDATTFNLYDTQLKSALTQLVSGHTSLGYNLARDKMFMEFDNQRVNGQGATQNTLECVYTGRLAVGYTSRTDAQSATYNFNTEHTYPQSNFGEAEPMKSDLYHLYPTDVTANSMRANYPFGKAVSNVTWQVGGSKLGFNNLGQQVFEPRDVHKGGVSRSMFYFIIRYPVNYGGFFTQTQENVFREWNKFDTVGVVESNRNNAIALLQLKRNPFIDHPEFADRIYSFATSNVRPVIAELNVLPLKVDFDSTLISTSTSNHIYIANSGSALLVVDSITISDSRFSVNSNNLSIESYSSKKALLQFHPDSIKNYSALLKVYSNAGVKEIIITGIGKDNTVNVEDEPVTPLAFILEQNYPNPFNPSTKISWQSPVSSHQSLKIYDVLGNEVVTLVNEFRLAGNYEVEFSAIGGSASSGNVAHSAAADLRAIASGISATGGYTSGVYFYRLQIGNFAETKKMVLLK